MNIKEFYHTVRKLKDIERAGWVERGVKNPESVSDHSFMVTLLCMILPKEGIDREKAIKMALVHDLVESVAGDMITKEHWEMGGTITKEEKSKKEEQALKRILLHLPEKNSKEIFDLWKEADEEKTTEAKFVKDVDIAEMIMQAYNYHSKSNFQKPLEHFGTIKI
jgi:5'-deoxynucleotidase YfbR-like HD superfamily hydrolase